MPSWKAFNLRLSWRIRHTQKRQKVISGKLTCLRDVKNEDRPGYVYEITDNSDKMSLRNAHILRKLTRVLQKVAELRGQLALNDIFGSNFCGTAQTAMSLPLPTHDENARSALECASSSYRLTPSIHTADVRAPCELKAVAAATALQGAFGTAIFVTAASSRRPIVRKSLGPTESRHSAFRSPDHRISRSPDS